MTTASACSTAERFERYLDYILEEVGQRMRCNGDSIYGCSQADMPKPEWGRYTQKGNRLYAHIFEESVGAIHLQGLAGKVKQARLVADGAELFVSRPWNAAHYPRDAFVNFAKPEHATHPLPARGTQRWS